VKENIQGGINMVHPGMVGITELMTDDNFLNWMEDQDEKFLENLNTHEIYKLYQKQA